jgi:hypothetical protein
LNSYEGTWLFGRLKKDKEALRFHFYREKKRLQDEMNQRILVALRTGLIIVDAAASGILREEIDLNKWIKGIFHETRLYAEDIRRKVIHPRITEIECRMGKAFVYHSFQEEAGRLGSVPIQNHL